MNGYRVLACDGLAVGLFLIAGVAALTGQVLTVGNLLATAAGVTVVSLAVRIHVLLLNRYHRGDWPFRT